MKTILPRTGFNWQRVVCQSPKEPAPERCGYCRKPLGVRPWTLFRDGRCAHACRVCQRRWWIEE